MHGNIYSKVLTVSLLKTGPRKRKKKKERKKRKKKKKKKSPR